jgi:hypothetical protein
MAVSSDQWLMLVYENQEYDPDNPWSGLFRSQLLVYVSVIHIKVDSTASIVYTAMQVYP